jgi:hypothetical protein
LTSDTSFTVEGFFLLQRTQLNATLIQLAPSVTFNLINGILCASLGSNISLIGTAVLSTDLWHQFSFVYDSTQQIATISIDGSIEATEPSIIPYTIFNNNNGSVIIGAGFYGYIDQLSILLKAKSQAVILWDATVAGYYPLDQSWLLDKGPNGLNATASNTILINGWHFGALNFNTTGATYQASGFTALGTAMHAFSIALWVRSETQAGIFLTVANSYTCLLVLGIQNTTNRVVAYLPNATAAGNGVNIVGPLLPSNAWVNVAFTWSSQNLARLYTSAFLQGSDGSANTLNNARGGNNSSPMTVTLGQYSGTANCQGIVGVDGSHQFMGSLDEVYVYARELQQTEIQELITV